MTIEAELRVMVGLWQQDAEWIDGYKAAGYDLMDYLNIKYEREPDRTIYCDRCRHSVWNGDRYCPNCGVLMRGMYPYPMRHQSQLEQIENHTNGVD